MATPVIMVHGAFCGGWVFDAFRRPFERAGHAVLALDLPGHEVGADRGATAGLSVHRYVDAVVEACKSQNEAPIIIGHSLGGLVAQLAASRAKVDSLVLLAPCAPWGVRGATMEEAFSALTLHGLGPYWSAAIRPEYALAARYLFDRLPRGERRAAFERLVPESGRALWETLNWWLDPLASTFVDPSRVEAPVLAVAGETDAICPATTVSLIGRRLGGTVEVFAGMSHWLHGEPGWKAVASACLSWLRRPERRLSAA